MDISSYFNSQEKDFNPYQVLTIYPTELGIFGSHTFHELMIADAARVNPYKRAFQRIGKQNSRLICVDIGSGLAPLTLLCAKYAAKKVYAIEQEASTFKLSEMIIKHQDASLSDKIHCLYGKSFDVNLPEKANLLVTETIGNFGVEEGIIPLLNDAKKRFLKQDAIIIPAELEFIVAPIESPRCHRRITFWKKPKYGINFSHLLTHATSSLYHHRVLPKELLSPPVKLGRLKLDGPKQINDMLTLEGECKTQRGGYIHGFAGWFRARLYDNVYLSNDPLKKRTPFSWTQVFFPMPNSDKRIAKLKPQQKIAISIKWDLASNQAIWDFKIR